MKKIYYLVFCVIIGMSISGCYYDNEEELYPRPVNDTAAVSYAKTIAPMIATNCSTPGCHTPNGQTPNLTIYQGVYNSRSVVKARAVEGNPSFMPAAGPMSTANRNALARWIDAGAPNN